MAALTSRNAGRKWAPRARISTTCCFSRADFGREADVRGPDSIRRIRSKTRALLERRVLRSGLRLLAPMGRRGLGIIAVTSWLACGWASACVRHARLAPPAAGPHAPGEYPGRFGFSVSHTTRQPRPGEEHGTHYFFTPQADMQDSINSEKSLCGAAASPCYIAALEVVIAVIVAIIVIVIVAVAVVFVVVVVAVLVSSSS